MPIIRVGTQDPLSLITQKNKDLEVQAKLKATINVAEQRTQFADAVSVSLGQSSSSLHTYGASPVKAYQAQTELKDGDTSAGIKVNLPQQASTVAVSHLEALASLQSSAEFGQSQKDDIGSEDKTNDQSKKRDVGNLGLGDLSSERQIED